MEMVQEVHEYHLKYKNVIAYKISFLSVYGPFNGNFGIIGVRRKKISISSSLQS